MERLTVGFVYVSHQTADDKYGKWNDGVYQVDLGVIPSVDYV